ncbi:ankyrin repeat domain-containing protein [Candidatus Micrarchaeota archaeon]|nr:ankyrin repeat domain-containing protein [Candidatus Micrarchaeota archaeon]
MDPSKLELKFLRAAVDNDMNTLIECINQGVNVNATDGVLEWNALMYAANNGHLEVVRMLIDKGADIHAKNISRWNAIMHAANSGSAEIIALLLETGAKTDIATMVTGVTPLILAAGKGHEKVVQVFIDFKLDLNVRDEGENTALIKATMNNHIKMVDLLIKAGADVTLKNDDDQTALDIAREKGYKEIARMLQKALKLRTDTEGVMKPGKRIRGVKPGKGRAVEQKKAQAKQ